MEKKVPHVLIIGGGIGGPALALFLNKAGIPSEIFEAYPKMDAVGGGFSIAQNGMRVLQTLGVADEVLKRGTPASLFAIENAQGKAIGSFTFESLVVNKFPAVNMSRHTLHDIFANELKEKEIPIHYEKKLISITHLPDKVVAHFEDGSQAEGDLLIGADGVNSAVRKHILPQGPHPSFTGTIGVGGFVPIEKLPPLEKDKIEGVTFVFGQKGFFGYGGADTGMMMWWTNLPREQEFTREELANPESNEVHNVLIEKFKDYQGPIPLLVQNTDKLIRHNIKDLLSLPTRHQDRIMLIGDAAHTVSPNSGQGASMALEDALLLARLLRDNKDYKEAYMKFEKARKDRVEKIVAEGRKREGDKEIVSPFMSKVREFLMKIFIKLFGLKGQIWILEYKDDWEATN